MIHRVGFMLCLLSWLAPAAWGLDPAVFLDPVKQDDDVLFREGLRERDLQAWIQQFDADQTQPDEADLAMRRRATLLTDAASAILRDDERQQRLREAHEILLQLIAAHPDHRSRLYWLLESARDDLERLDTAAFEAVLVLELGGRDLDRVAERAAAALKTLAVLQRETAAIWEATGKLEDAAIDQAAAQGSLWIVGAIQQPAALLTVWAQLCDATTADMPRAERVDRFRKLLAEVTERRGWTQSESGPAPHRAQALLIAAIAARKAGQFDVARRYAQQLIGLINNMPASAQLSSLGLLAVLEQIRALRDAGNVDQARQAIAQARTWAAEKRPGDLPTDLAIGLTERSVLARSAASGKAPADLLEPAESLAPVLKMMADSHRARDYVYRALADALAHTAFNDEMPAASLQLLVGSAINDLAEGGDTDAGKTQRASQAVAAAQKCMASSSAVPATTRGELIYLIGRARYLQKQPVEAASSLLTLAEQYPDHDRAPAALEQAVAVLQEQLFGEQKDPPTSAWALFVRTAGTYRQRFPQSPLAADLSYQLGVALEHIEQFDEAAKAYADVPADHVAAANAALHRAQCLYRLSQTRATDSQPADNSLQAEVERAARQALARTKPAAAAERCQHAQAIVLLADVLNHASPAQPEEALELLVDFRKQYADCASLLAPAQRERIHALLQLKKIPEARQAVEEFLKTDPKFAGPVLAGLIEALQRQAGELADADNIAALRALSEETLKLTASLLRWANDHPGSLSETDALTVRIWRAQSLLNTDQPGLARDLFNDLSTPTAPRGNEEATSLTHTEVRLGLADSLRMLGQAREALPIYAGIYRSAEEESPFWWHALTGSLRCHAELGSDPREIVQAIRQRRHLSPDLGNAHWRRILNDLEQDNQARTAEPPPASPDR